MWLKRARHRGTLGRGLTIFSGSRWWEAPGWFWSPAFHQKIPWRSQTCLKATSKRLRKSGWPWATLQGSRVMYIYMYIGYNYYRVLYNAYHLRLCPGRNWSKHVEFGFCGMKAKKFTTYNQRWSNARIQNGTKGPQPGRIKTKKYKDSIKHDKTSPGTFWRPYIGEPLSLCHRQVTEAVGVHFDFRHTCSSATAKQNHSGGGIPSWGGRTRELNQTPSQIPHFHQTRLDPFLCRCLVFPSRFSHSNNTFHDYYP
jgi:hypothetical protein